MNDRSTFLNLAFTENDWTKLTEAAAITGEPDQAAWAYKILMAKVTKTLSPMNSGEIYREIGLLLVDLRYRANPVMIKDAENANVAGEWHLALSAMAESLIRDEIPIWAPEHEMIILLAQDLDITIDGQFTITDGPVEQYYRPRNKKA